jgi:hypothetical protein
MHVVKRMASTSATIDLLYDHDKFILTINALIESFPIGSEEVFNPDMEAI